MPFRHEPCRGGKVEASPGSVPEPGKSAFPRRETRRFLVCALAAGILSVLAAQSRAEGLRISGGIDARYLHESHPSDDAFKIEGSFLNLRKVWSDEQGDRWIAVGQADFDDNFRDIRPYQVYLQYKGPLGKWNLRGGHFLLPFGLLATYDTERLLLQGLERTSLGSRKDTGLQGFGHVGDWDYSVAVTEGIGDRRFSDVDHTPLATGRLAYVGEDWHLGFSLLAGRVLIDPRFKAGEGVVSERRIALDAMKSSGPLTVRVEAIGGTDDGRGVGGGIVLAEYSLTSKLDLNLRYAWWHHDGDRRFAGLGLSYLFRPGLYARLGDNYEFGKEEKNVFAAQIYFEFSRML